MTETLQPATAADVAGALKRAADARQSIVIRGAGTKSDWGRPAGRVDAVLDMTRMNRILAHEHGDMTATIEAGATLADVNRALAAHGQMLALDPPFADRATIGGLLATNDSGPLRHRYGTPRDLVIGIQLATTDGVLSKAGGQVVKNVAGYDLSKLVTGSFGSLAAIVSATFKLAPIPAASKTLRVGIAGPSAAAAIVKTMMSSQLEPIAFELAMGTQRSRRTQSQETFASSADSAFLVRFASLPVVVDAQLEQAIAALEGSTSSLEILEGDFERALWDAHATEIWNQPGAIVRASWLPARIEPVLAGLKTCASFLGRAAIGAGLIRIDGDTDAQAAAINGLRAAADLGNIVIVRGSPELKARVDVWGSFGDRQPLLESLKRALDPHGVLNAGRGPL